MNCNYIYFLHISYNEIEYEYKKSFFVKKKIFYLVIFSEIKNMNILNPFFIYIF